MTNPKQVKQALDLVKSLASEMSNKHGVLSGHDKHELIKRSKEILNILESISGLHYGDDDI